MKNQAGLDKMERKIAIKAGLIDEDQEWFWTPKWQAKEKEADEDLRTKHYETFDSVNDLLADLKGSV